MRSCDEYIYSVGIKRTKKPYWEIPNDLPLKQTSNADAANKKTGISNAID